MNPNQNQNSNYFLNLLEKTGVLANKAAQSLEQNKATDYSVGGALKNTGINALQLMLGVPQSVSAAGQLQQEYGNPNELMVNDPAKYVQTMLSPVANYSQHMLEYTPIPDVLNKNIGQYPERVAQKVYSNPLTTLIDAIAVAEAVLPNKANILAGDKAKLETAASKARANVTPEQLELQAQRQVLEGKKAIASGTAKKQYQKAIDKNIENTAELLKNKQLEETVKTRFNKAASKDNLLDLTSADKLSQITEDARRSFRDLWTKTFNDTKSLESADNAVLNATANKLGYAGYKINKGTKITSPVTPEEIQMEIIQTKKNISALKNKSYEKLNPLEEEIKRIKTK